MLEKLYYFMLEQFQGITLVELTGMIVFEICVVHIGCEGVRRLRNIELSWKREILYIIFGMYLCFLLQITLLNRNPGSRGDIYIIPFYAIIRWDGSVNKQAILYALCNCLLFIPYGGILGCFQQRYSFLKQLVLAYARCFLTSLMIEMLQLITKRGHFEIEDLICNTVGGLFGFLVVILIRKIFKKGKEIKNEDCAGRA